jgi:hypothetical protein
MRILIALLLPWVAFFTIGKPFTAIVCLILQITLIGWPIAAIWAVVSVNNYYADRRHRELVKQLRG